MTNHSPPEDPGAEEAVPLSPAALILKLREEHRALDEEIHELYDYPFRDQLHLQRLKKKKLRIKDQIEQLKDDLIPDLNA